MQESWAPMVKQQPDVPWAHLNVVFGCCNSPLLFDVTLLVSLHPSQGFCAQEGLHPAIMRQARNKEKPILSGSNGCKYHSHLVVFGTN